MTQMVEFDLAKILESMDQKLNRVLEAQIRLEGEVKTLQVEIQNVKEDVRDIKITERWLIGLFLTLIGVIGTVLIRVFNL